MFVEPGAQPSKAEAATDETLWVTMPNGYATPDHVKEVDPRYRQRIHELVAEAAHRYDPDQIHERAANSHTPCKDRRRKKEQVPDDIDIPEISDEELLASAGVEPVYSTKEAADFFDMSNQWLYWGLRENIFTYPNGDPIVPERVGDPSSGRRRFTLPIIKEILLSSYRRGNITPEKLKKVLRRIRIAELGGNWKTRENWTAREISILSDELMESSRRKNHYSARPASGYRGMGELVNTVSAPGFDADKDYEERTQRARDYAERTEPADLTTRAPN